MRTDADLRIGSAPSGTDAALYRKTGTRVPDANRSASGAVLAERLPVWCALTAVLATGFWLQTHTIVNQDVAWILWGARRMLNGAQFGRDIIEPNPPLAWFISMPPAWIAGVLHLQMVDVFRLYVALLTLGSLGTCHSIIRSTEEDIGARQAWLFTLTAALYLFVFCYRDFGQRELLAEIFALPYLVMAAARMQGTPFPRLIAAAVGAAAGIGFGLKPYFLAVPLLVELVGIIARRDWRFVLRPEPMAMAAVMLIYVAVVLILARPYLFEVIPLARIFYSYFDSPLAFLAAASAVPVIGLFFAIAGLSRLKFPPLPTVFATAAFGFLSSYFVQMKGLTYHLFPVSMNTALALTLLILPLVRSNVRILTIAAAGALVLLIGSGVSKTAVWWQQSRIGSGQLAEIIRIFSEEINQRAQGGRFLFLSTYPYPGFPVALAVNATWGSRSSAQWFLPAVVQLREGAHPANPDTLEVAEREARAFALHDLAEKPNIVLIDGGPRRFGIGTSRFDFLSFYLEDRRFREAWAPYREVESIGPYRIFVRNTEPGA